MGIKNGFTFIEMMITVAVIGFALPALFSIVFSITRQQIKLIRLSEVKRQGDTLLTSMENTIRNNAVKIYSANTLQSDVEWCASNYTGTTTPQDSIYFIDKLNNGFGYVLNSGTDIIASASGSPLTTLTDLTTSKTTISSLSFSCTRNSRFSTPTLNISFRIDYNTASTRKEDIAGMDYQTQIGLKNY